MTTYNAIGVMSGTSVDGLDISACTFHKNRDDWSFELGPSETIDYPKELRLKLTQAITLSATELSYLNIEFGQFIGSALNDFFVKKGIAKNEIDLIASHGHTVFHQPKKGLTLQIGDGASIAASTGCLTINDFRSLDVALGGNGAPLVPIGDHMLFSDYDACLNIGGFANVSFVESDVRIAFDITPANIVLNKLATRLGKEYDKGGNLASSGNLLQPLLDELNGLDYYQTSPPKSLGLEWVQDNISPLLIRKDYETIDLMHTFTEHIAYQIGRALPKQSKILITGGGAHNTYLMKRIRENSSANIHIPTKNIVDFKEAIIFSFLGVLRLRNEINTLKSVTGASKNSVGGCIYHPFSVS